MFRDGHLHTRIGREVRGLELRGEGQEHKFVGCEIPRGPHLSLVASFRVGPVDNQEVLFAILAIDLEALLEELKGHSDSALEPKGSGEVIVVREKRAPSRN